jgi:hypothetical protein
MQKTITLEIANVPDVESVLTEIKANAETTIRNYWDKEIRVVPEAKEVEFQSKIDSFRTVNKMVAEPVEEITEVEKGGIIKPL